MRILASAGVFSSGPDFTDHRRTLEFGPLLPADGIELIFYRSWYGREREIRDDLRRAGLAFPVLHAEKTIGAALDEGDALERLERNLALASAVGSELVVLHLWELPESDARLPRHLDVLPQCLDLAEAAGVQLAVETILCDHGDPLGNVARAIGRDDRCLVALDTEFLAAHGQVESSLADERLWATRAVAHIHVKDFHPDTGLQPGDGVVDFDAFFGGLSRRGFAGTVTLESTSLRNGRVDVDEARASLERLRALAA